MVFFDRSKCGASEMIKPKLFENIDCDSIISGFHHAQQNSEVFENTSNDSRVFFSEETFRSRHPSTFVILEEIYKSFQKKGYEDWSNLSKLILVNRVTGDPTAVEGSGGGYHCDSFLSFQIKLFIYLSDVEGGCNGAFEYASKPANLIFKIIKIPIYAWTRLTNGGGAANRFDFIQILGEKILDRLFIPVVGKAGLSWLVDTRVLHRGRPNTSEVPRYMLTVYLYHKGDDGFLKIAAKAI